MPVRSCELESAWGLVMATTAGEDMAMEAIEGTAEATVPTEAMGMALMLAATAPIGHITADMGMVPIARLTMADIITMAGAAGKSRFRAGERPRNL